MGCTNKYVYVTEQYKPFILKFNKELEPIGQIRFPLAIVDIKILSDDDIAISAISVEGAAKIIIIDAEGKIKRELIYSHIKEKASVLMNCVDFDIDPSGCYYLAYHYQDRLEKYDEKGSLIWKKSLFNNKKVPFDKIGDQNLPMFNIYKDIVLDKKGNIFVLGGGLSEHKSRDVYILDKHGNQKAVITLPETTHCIYLNHDNYIFSRANEGITIKKYALEAY